MTNSGEDDTKQTPAQEEETLAENAASTMTTPGADDGGFDQSERTVTFQSVPSIASATVDPAQQQDASPPSPRNEDDMARRSSRPGLVRFQSRIDLATGMPNQRRQSIRKMDHEMAPNSRWKKFTARMMNKNKSSPAMDLLMEELQREEEQQQRSGALATIPDVAGTSSSVVETKGSTINLGHEDSQKDAGGVSLPNVFRIHSSSASTNRAGDLVTDGWMTSSLSEFLRWTFRATFTEVFLVSYLIFLVLIVLFAIFVYWIGRVQPYCVNVLGANFTAAGTQFMDS